MKTVTIAINPLVTIELHYEDDEMADVANPFGTPLPPQKEPFPVKEPEKVQQSSETLSEVAARVEAARLKQTEQTARAEEAQRKELAAAQAQAKKPVELTEAQREHKKKIHETHNKIQDILKKHNGMESNIGINNEYWGLQNQLRALNSEMV